MAFDDSFEWYLRRVGDQVVSGGVNALWSTAREIGVRFHSTEKLSLSIGTTKNIFDLPSLS